MKDKELKEKILKTIFHYQRQLKDTGEWFNISILNKEKCRRDCIFEKASIIYDDIDNWYWRPWKWKRYDEIQDIIDTVETLNGIIKISFYYNYDCNENRPTKEKDEYIEQERLIKIFKQILKEMKKKTWKKK